MIETHPILGSALQFAFEKSTMEGKLTICGLLILSFFSWTVIFSKIRQLIQVTRSTKKFFKAYEATSTPLELARSGQKFEGSPAYEMYAVACAATENHLKHGSHLVHGERRMSPTHFDTIRAAMERAVSDQGMILERGMIVLSTAVAGGPFIGLLGTVWGVMETFAGIAKAAAASLTAMAPGVAGALIATVVGLFVALPAMFAYNFMVTKIRAMTQQLDAFAGELASELELRCVDSNPWSNHGLAAAVALSAPAAAAAPAQRTAPALKHEELVGNRPVAAAVN